MRTCFAICWSLAVVVAVLAAFRPAPAALPDDAKGPTRSEVPKPLKLEEAEKLVRAFIFTENPRMNPLAQFPLKEMTTKAIADRLGVQVFQVTEGVQARETFVVREKKVHRIGVGFGGPGVTSLAVADPSGDGRDKLIYAYAWGSGEHRSNIAVFDCLAKEPKQIVAPQTYVGDSHDLTVMQGRGNAVEIYVGKQKVGRLDLQGKEGEFKALLRLENELPAAIKQEFKDVP